MLRLSGRLGVQPAGGQQVTQQQTKPKTRVAYCCQKVGAGKDRGWCKNVPSQDIEYGNAWLGSFCDSHARLVRESLRAEW